MHYFFTCYCILFTNILSGFLHLYHEQYWSVILISWSPHEVISSLATLAFNDNTSWEEQLCKCSPCLSWAPEEKLNMQYGVTKSAALLHMEWSHFAPPLHRSKLIHSLDPASIFVRTPPPVPKRAVALDFSLPTLYYVHVVSLLLDMNSSRGKNKSLFNLFVVSLGI